MSFSVGRNDRTRTAHADPKLRTIQDARKARVKSLNLSRQEARRKLIKRQIRKTQENRITDDQSINDIKLEDLPRVTAFIDRVGIDEVKLKMPLLSVHKFLEKVYLIEQRYPSKEEIEKLMNSLVPDRLVKLFGAKQYSTAFMATLLSNLVSITSFHPSICEAVTTEKLLADLVDCAKHHPESLIRDHSVEVIHNLISSKVVRQTCLQAGLTNLMIELLKKSAEDPIDYNLMETVTITIANLVRDVSETNGITPVYEATKVVIPYVCELLKNLFPVLQHQNQLVESERHALIDPIISNLMLILVRMADGDETEQRQVLMSQYNVCDLTGQLLSVTHDRTTIRFGMALLCDMSCSDAVAQKMIDHGVIQFLETFVRVQVVDIENLPLFQYVYSILSNLTVSPEAVHQVIACDIFEVVKSHTTCHSKDVASSAVALITRLGLELVGHMKQYYLMSQTAEPDNFSKYISCFDE